jgi:Fe-S cluster assembly protein SufD
MTDVVGERSEFLAPFSELEKELTGQGPEWLRRLRRAGLERFIAEGFPSTRQEEWRTTNVAPIARTRFRPAMPASSALATLPAAAELGSEVRRLVFLNGHLIDRLSSPTNGTNGVWAGSLAAALKQIPGRLEQHLTRRDLAEGSAFCALNAAYSVDGGVVLVEDGEEAERPVQLIYLASPGADPLALHPRTLVVVGRGSRASVVESYLGLNRGVYLTNSVTDVVVGENGSLRHDRIQLEGEGAYHISTIESVQAGNSRYASMNLDLGGGLVRHDLRAVLDGEGANCDLDGLYLTLGTQHVDNHTTIDHARAHCSSREVYKGVLSGRSRTTFNGRIVVRQDAQQTDAKQSNPNLLLSPGALAQTRPQLEIYADDVKCTHGATVGRLDEEAIFYLRSRAIPAAQARDLLVTAFAGELLERIELDALRRRMEEAVAARLPAMRG